MNVKKTLLPILIICLAAGLTLVLIKSRKVPEPHETPHMGPLVEVAELVETTRGVVVTSTGTVQPRHEVSITPQVRGKVVEISPRMIGGGVFLQGEEMFAIEDVDYKLAIELARSNLAQAELELLRTENLAAVARQEWQKLNPGEAAAPNPLVVYEPQLKSARAQRDAALANLKQAELNLQRTRVVAPFNCFVRSEQLEIGQYLNAGAPVATVAGTDLVEIVVPLPLDQLAWLSVPRHHDDKAGSRAVVELNAGERIHSWQGAITRAMGEIDPRSRMARVVVTVAEPVAEDAGKDYLLRSLLPGMFVEVQLQGSVLERVIVVPRGALHDDDTLWVVDDENRLRIRTVKIMHRELDEILIGSGVQPGEKIVLTNLSAAAEGMLLRPQLSEASQ